MERVERIKKTHKLRVEKKTQIISDPSLMQVESRKWMIKHKRIGFVPTMGSLHEGHLSLVRKCKSENDVTVVSIFVNPKQFGPNEDYRRYPRTPEKDLELLKPLEVETVFNPGAQEMFPHGFQSRVNVEKLSEPLYGKVRPHFFGGVALVVLKLFHLVNPTRAYFGEKDYQQLLVVRQMVKDLNLEIEIVPCPIVREPDGLAMSSRNAYLSNAQREKAPFLYQALQQGERAVRGGEKNPVAILKLMEKTILQIPHVKIDYVAVVDPETLLPVNEIGGKAFLGIAVRLGETRLIDSLVIDPE